MKKTASIIVLLAGFGQLVKAKSHTYISADGGFGGLFNYLWIAFGILFLWAVVRFLLKRRRLKTKGIRVEGTVVEMIEVIDNSDDDDMSDRLYYPVIKYITRDGKTVTKKHDVGCYPPAHHAGDRVFIFYDPDDIKTFIIE